MKRMKAIRAALARYAERALEPNLLFPGIAVLLLAVIWSATFYLLRVEEESTIRKTIDSSIELLETYEAQMVRNLETISQTLRTTKYAYELNPSSAVLSNLREKSLLPPSLVFTVSVIDRNGMALASTKPLEQGHVTEQPFFLAHQERDSGTPFVSSPMEDKKNGEWRIQFSLRLNNAEGAFAGAVVVSVGPEYFTSGYDASRLGNEGVLGLLGADKTFLSRRTGEQASWGEMAGIAARQANDRQVPVAPAIVSPWDSVPRYIHARQLHGFPLAVVVGLSEREQLASFEKYRQDYVWKAIVASFLVLFIVAAMGVLSWQLTNSKRRIRKAQETYYAASDASLDAFYVLRSQYSTDGSIQDFVLEDTNRRGAALLGTTKANLIGKSLCVAFPESRQNGIFNEFARVAQNNAVDEREWENRNPQIHAVWLQRQLVAVEDGLVAIVRDISERKRAEILRLEQAQVLEMIATGTPLEEVLHSLLRLIASQLPGMIGSILLLEKCGKRLVHGAAIQLPREYTQAIDGVLVGPKAGSCGTAVHRQQPVIVADILQDPLWDDYRDLAIKHGLRACWSTPILSQQKQVLGTFAMYHREVHAPTQVEKQLIEIATRIAGIAIERKQVEDRIRHVAHHDPLTGLPNRSLLEDRMQQAMRHVQRYGGQMTVVFIDLDNFKLINDSMGHNTGDELLKIVAQRMVQSVRRTDTVLRLGGDEFFIVLHHQSNGAEGAALPLRKLHEAIAQPVSLAGKEIQVTCSMGLATYPVDGKEPDTLLMNADAAMYRAKELGRNNFQFYTAEMHEQIQEKLALQDGLRNALVRNEFFLVYQPQVDLRSGDITGMEALIRWRHPELGIVSPLKFIPLAEETGLIVPIGEWVLRNACAQNKAWQQAGMPACVVSVNVSARQFREGDLTKRVAQALQESRLEPRFLELELTESLIMRDRQRAVAAMDELQAMGVRLSIDDFGIGYSSLNALKSFPIQRLKLDRSFVSDLPDDEDDKAITMAVISLGHQLNLRIVAEGVESEQQQNFLRDKGCDEMQGYYFSKPVLPEHIPALFRRQQENAQPTESLA